MGRKLTESDMEVIADVEPFAPTADTGLKTADGTEVEGAAAEAFIAEKRIGERIKRLRLKRSMGLVELGRQTGLSASFLSQLETGRVVPTLRNLARISLVFGKDLSYFFEAEARPLFRIHRKSERTRKPQTGAAENPSYYFESLGYMVPERQFDPYYAEFLPQKKNSEMRAHVHAGAEFLYVIGGELEIQHADKLHVLGDGDGVYFDASVPHAYRCHGETPTQVIIVTLHQQPVQQNAVLSRPASNGVRPQQGLMGRAAELMGAGAGAGEGIVRRRERPSA